MTEQWIGGGLGFDPVLLHDLGARNPAMSMSVAGWSALTGVSNHLGPGYTVGLSKWEGWSGGTSIVTDSQQSPTGDGTLDGSGAFGGHTYTFSGRVHADPRTRESTSLEDAEDALCSVLTGTVRKGVLRVTSGARGLVRETDVRLASSTPDFTPITPWVATWSLYLYAADPLRYGVEATTIPRGQTVTVPNVGTAMSRPLVDLYGPLTNPTITAGGNTLTLTVNIPAGTVLTVDMRRRVVRNAAGSKTFTPVSGYWHHVNPGGAAFTLGGTGSGYAVMRRSSAWM